MNNIFGLLENVIIFFIFTLFINAYVPLPWNFDVLRYFVLALSCFTFLYTHTLVVALIVQIGKFPFCLSE